MAAISTATESQFSRDIQELLTLLFPSTTFTTSTDSNGYPNITWGTVTAGSQGCYIKVVPSNDVSGVDALGLTQRVFQPHVVQAVFEESGTSNVLVLTSDKFSQILQALQKVGAKIELYKTTNGTGPSDAGVTGSAWVTLWPDLYNKMKQQS